MTYLRMKLPWLWSTSSFLECSRVARLNIVINSNSDGGMDSDSDGWMVDFQTAIADFLLTVFWPIRPIYTLILASWFPFLNQILSTNLTCLWPKFSPICKYTYLWSTLHYFIGSSYITMIKYQLDTHLSSIIKIKSTQSQWLPSLKKSESYKEVQLYNCVDHTNNTDLCSIMIIASTYMRHYWRARI